MKNEIKVVAVVLVALVIFLSGFGLGAAKKINITVQNEGGAVVQQPVQQQPVVQQPVVQQPVQQTPAPAPQQQETTKAPVADTQETTAAPAGDSGASSTVKVPSTPAECCEAYRNAVNTAKKYTGNATVRRVEQIDVGVNDCSVPMLKGALDSVVRSFIKSSDETFEIVNGSYTNDSGETRTMNDRLYPGGRDVTVAEANVASATAVANGDGGYTVTLKFPSEQSLFENGTVHSSPTNHLTAVDPLDLATLDLSPFEIFKADMKYSGATVDATVNAEGILTKLHINLPLEGVGQGGKGSIKLDIGVAGFMDTTFEITYK